MVLKALILVGGYGTRLRPLTFTKPKPLVEFVNKPIVIHQIEALVAAGVREIIFAVCHKPKALEEELLHVASKLGIEIHFTIEREPLGTGGPMRLNEKLLDPSDEDPFFMLNADVIADYAFDKLLHFHKSHGNEGSIYVTPVEDPSRYGVVVAKDNGQVIQFVEKPKDGRYGNSINAGLYLLNKSVIQRVKPGLKTSIERQVFPGMARDGQLFMLSLPGYWMDVGKPGDFLNGQNLYLNAIARRNDERIAQPSMNINGNVVIAESANISRSAVIGPNVVIGPGCVIGHNVRIKNTCVLGGVQISDAAFISDSIIGWRSRIGKWARLQNRCILGEDVTVKPEVCLVGVTVCPNKSCSADNYDPQEAKIIL